MENISRRQTLALAVAACASCALGAEEESDSNSKAPPPKSLKIGKLSDYAKDGYYDAYRDSKVFVARVDGRLVAMSAFCTHKRCVLKLNDPETLRCPCHKSIFSPHGTPTGGKAKTALARFALSEGADGTITVDTTQSFAEREWENPKAFIEIPKPG